MRLGKADAMTLIQKIEYYYSDPTLRANWTWNMDENRKGIKAIFVANNGKYLFTCQVHLDC